MKNSITIESPIGRLTIQEEDGFLTNILFGESDRPSKNSIISPIIQKTINELEEYFMGRRKTFSIPLKPKGTEFQQKVWEALTKIPYKQTRSYKEIANAVNCPMGSRAVGNANNRNPLPIIIPCHRVIGANGLLVGYAGGLDIKQRLLKIESDNVD